MRKIIPIFLFLFLGGAGLSFLLKDQSPQATPELLGSLERDSETENASPLDEITLSVSPAVALQGEPVFITVEGPVNSAALSSLTLGDTELDMFNNQGRWSALVGISLNHKPGAYPLILTLADGRIIEKTLEVKERVMATEDFDIPEHFGGNTREGDEKLTSNLAKDSATLNAITGIVSPQKLWEGSFRYPRDDPIVITDTYGYSRQTGSTNLSHNGLDFRAAVGTPVYAMNSGRVAFSGTFRNYGHTVIIDHGLGLMTMYMHLSEILVTKDEMVKKGHLIAKSGNTGYSLAPHLHLSVRINGSSIDPEKFLALLGEK